MDLFLSSPRISVEDYHKRVQRLIKVMQIHPNDKRYLEFRAQIARILKYFDYYLKQHESIIHPEKLKLIYALKSLFQKLLDAKSQQEMAQLESLILREFSALNLMSSSYLVRHPEKADANHISAQSASGRELSTLGVKQAKEFSDKIIDEILLTNNEVIVFLGYSYYKRTKIFASIVDSKLRWAAGTFDKRIKVFMSPEDLLSGDLVNVPEGQGIDQWVSSPNAHACAKSDYEWFSTRHTGNYSHYVINIGITHLPNISAFVYHQLGASPAKAKDFRYADFI